MSLKPAARMAAVALLFGGVATGCSATDAGEPSPSASVSAPEDLSPGVFDLAETRAALASLSAPAPYRWSINSATEYPANGQQTSDEFYSVPDGCSIFYDMIFLRFADDSTRAPDDAIFDATYLEDDTSGSGEPGYRAFVRFRVLDDASRAESEIIGALTAATEGCIGGYQEFSEALGWTIQDVTGMDILPPMTDLPEGATTVTYRLYNAGGDPDEVIVWASLDNLAIIVDHYVESDSDGGDREVKSLGVV